MVIQHPTGEITMNTPGLLKGTYVCFLVTSSISFHGCATDNGAEEPTVPMVAPPSENESTLTVHVNEQGDLESVSTSEGETLESADLESALRQNLPTATRPRAVCTVGNSVCVTTRVDSGPVGRCFGSRIGPYTVMTLYVRGVAVTNMRVHDYAQSGRTCVGISEDRMSLCGGPWCVVPTDASAWRRAAVEQLLARYVGHGLAKTLARVLVLQSEQWATRTSWRV
jgi:hypothetical protein